MTGGLEIVSVAVAASDGPPAFEEEYWKLSGPL